MAGDGSRVELDQVKSTRKRQFDLAYAGRQPRRQTDRLHKFLLLFYWNILDMFTYIIICIKINIIWSTMAVVTCVCVCVCVCVRVQRAMCGVICPVQCWSSYQDNSYNHKNSHNFSDTTDISILIVVLWIHNMNCSDEQKFHAPEGVIKLCHNFVVPDSWVGFSYRTALYKRLGPPLLHKSKISS